MDDPTKKFLSRAFTHKAAFNLANLTLSEETAEKYLVHAITLAQDAEGLLDIIKEQDTQIKNLLAVATSQIGHTYNGRCPDGYGPDGHHIRDPKCPACALLPDTVE